MMWLCLGATGISVLATFYFLHQDEKRSSLRNKRMVVIFIILAHLSFGAAAWFGNKPEWLNPY